MTREEAIKVLKNMPIPPTDDYSFNDIGDALYMAVEALNREQEKYDAICSELVALKNNLNEPLEVAMAYENSIAIVRKYAERF